jgi:hypothetical protein
MKLLLLSLLLTFGAQAQTMGAIKAKAEMLKRTQEMRVASDEARELLSALQLEQACQKINFIFKEMPNHLSSIMNRMNIFDKKIQGLKDESLNLLKDTHRLNNRCEQGDSFEYVDPTATQVFLKNFSKRIKKHEKLIKKSSTDFNNTYYYQYEF